MAIRQNELSIPEQAARWFYTLKQSDGAEQVAFGVWLKESPRHVEEFLLATAAYRAFDELKPGKRVDVEAILAEATANVVPLQDSSRAVTGQPSLDAPTRSIRRRHQAAWAFAAVMVIAVALSWVLSWDKRSYATEVGEQRVFDLTDGTVVYLNTQSRLEVQYSKTARDVRLLSGEALFKVARDAARPFVVHADAATIQAVGTQFNVYRREGETRVSVIEGAVRIAADEKEMLKAGEEASVTSGGRITRRAALDAVQVSAWRQRRLVFRGEPLKEVAAEFNRYNRAPQIRVEGEIASERQLMGIFDADDPESLILFLGDAKDLVVERRGEEFVVKSR